MMDPTQRLKDQGVTDWTAVAQHVSEAAAAVKVTMVAILADMTQGV